MGRTLGRKLLDRFIWLDYQLYRFFSFWGEVIVSRPNKFFYAVLIIVALFFPLFSAFLVLSLLCHAYKKHSER